MGTYVNGYLYNTMGGVSSEKIVEATENWLEENIDPSVGYAVDKTLTIEGAAADAKATGDSISDLKSALKDLSGFETAEFIQGGYYSTPSSGSSVFVENADWCCTKIPYGTGYTVYAYATGASGNQRAYALLDESGNVLSRASGNDTMSGPHTSGNVNARYMVINNKLSAIPSGYYAYYTPAPYVQWLPALMDRAFYARNSKVITDLDIDSAPGYFTYTTTAHPLNTPSELDGKAFTLLNFNANPANGNLRTVQIIIAHSAIGAEQTSRFMYRYKLTAGWGAWITLSKVGDATRYWCYGKKINWAGDSIVSGGDFDELTSEALGMTETDYGISGSTIALAGDGTDGRDAIVARFSSMSDDADIIAISAGSNDWMYAWSPIGDMDSTSNSTFYGALKNLCEGLLTKYPTKVIFFTTPIKRAQAFTNGNGGTYTPDGVYTDPSSKNKYGKTLMDYCDIIKEVCGYYGIPVLDMNRESGLNPSIAAQADLFADKTHPGAAGKRIMARRVTGWLTQLAFQING